MPTTNRSFSRAADQKGTKKRRCLGSAASSANPDKIAKTSVLDMLQHGMANREMLDEPKGMKSPQIVEQVQEQIALEPMLDVGNMNKYVIELTRAIDTGRIALAGSPWVSPSSPQHHADAQNKARRAQGESELSPEEIYAIVARPSVFAWAPDRLCSAATIKCPLCRQEIKEMRWHEPRLLHGVSHLSSYVTREYICTRCKPVGGQHRRRQGRKKFLADTPAFLRSLPEHVQSLWTLHNTGQILCDASVVDLVRAMATKSSWSAIAECINEMRQTAWVRSVSLPYLRLCAHLGVRAASERSSFPNCFCVQAKWVRRLFMVDWQARRDEVQEELRTVRSTDVLAVDWTRDAAARCSGQWLFNAMDGQHAILCSGLTTTSDPASAADLLRELAERCIAPKVVYVDSECCGAWRPLVQKLWPDAFVRLDAMHAIRRLTRTTSSTQHPWHGRFCQALSAAIYTEDAAVVRRIREARREVGLDERIPKRTRAMCIPRKIIDAPRIVEAIEAVLRQFQAPDGQLGSLLTKQTLEAWKNLRGHIVNGCLCDPCGIELNVYGEEQIVDGILLPIVCKARGASALEGFHAHQKSWLGTLAHHAVDAGEALLADGALRWNRRILGHPDAQSNERSIYAPGLLREVAAARKTSHQSTSTQ